MVRAVQLRLRQHRLDEVGLARGIPFAIVTHPSNELPFELRITRHQRRIPKQRISKREVTLELGGFPVADVEMVPGPAASAQIRGAAGVVRPERLSSGDALIASM